MIDVLSLGAGVQSTCVLLMSCEGVLPKIDCAVFADTQWEPKLVYAHLQWLKAHAESCGIPVHIVTCGNIRDRGIAFHYEQAGQVHTRWASMPLYIKNPDGSSGIMQRHCTKEYKIEPIGKFIRYELLGLKPRQVAPKLAVRHWFGISSDEVYRKRTSQDHWQEFYYPLIDTVVSPKTDTLFGRGFDRQDCLDWIASRGFPKPPRSACVGCPFHSDAEWLKMKIEDPESFADAVAFDLEIRSADSGTADRQDGRLVGKPYLHRSCVPLDEMEFNERLYKVGSITTDGKLGMAEECLGMCGV